MHRGTGDPKDLRWRLLAVTVIGSFMGAFDSTVVAVALPTMGAELHFGFLGGIWIQALYLVTVTVTLIPVGRMSDSLGRLRLYRTGVAVFAVSSILAGLSLGLAALLAARAVQGLGAALMSATGTAIVADAFPAGERGRALGINVTSVYLGLVLGPVIGGLLTEQLGWRSIFFVNILVAAATLVGAWGLRERLVPERVRIDVPGVGLLAGGVSLALVAIILGPIWGWAAPRTLACLALAALALALFLAVEARAGDPLLDLGLFTGSRSFSAGTLSTLLVYMGVFGVTALTSIYLEVVDGKSPESAGVVLSIQPVFMVALSFLAGHLSDRFGSRLLATGGVLLLAGGMATMATTSMAGSPLSIEGGLALVGLGMAFFSSPNTSAVMGAAPRSKLGTASGTLATMRSLGQSLSMAVLGALATSPLGPHGAQELFAGQARGFEAGAYVAGYRLAMAVGAVIALVAAGISALRGDRSAEPVQRGDGR